MAYLLDADPEIARARKPEYPIDFLHGCRRTYFLLAGILGCMTVIPPLPLSDAKREVENAMAGVLAKGETQIAADLDTASALYSRTAPVLFWLAVTITYRLPFLLNRRRNGK